MSIFNHQVAVITGAGSGIGKALAIELASRSARLALSDINADNLHAIENKLTNNGTQVFAEVVDTANQQAVFDHAQAVYNHFGQVNLLINNAGVALASGNFWDTPLEDFKWLMEINFYGMVYGSKAFLPYLEQAQWAHLVNVSSLFGLIAVPHQTAYHASKFAIRGVTESLNQELIQSGSHVRCTSVHPGGIKTNIARDARVTPGNHGNHAKAVTSFEKLARTSAEQAARQILRAVEKRKARLLIGADAKLLDLLQRLMPVSYTRLLGFLLPKPNER